MVEKIDILCSICGKKYMQNPEQPICIVNLQIITDHKHCLELMKIKKQLEIEILNVDWRLYVLRNS